MRRCKFSHVRRRNLWGGNAALHLCDAVIYNRRWSIRGKRRRCRRCIPRPERRWGLAWQNNGGGRGHGRLQQGVRHCRARGGAPLFAIDLRRGPQWVCHGRIRFGRYSRTGERAGQRGCYAMARSGRHSTSDLRHWRWGGAIRHANDRDGRVQLLRVHSSRGCVRCAWRTRVGRLERNLGRSRGAGGRHLGDCCGQACHSGHHRSHGCSRGNPWSTIDS